MLDWGHTIFKKAWLIAVISEWGTDCAFQNRLGAVWSLIIMPRNRNRFFRYNHFLYLIVVQCCCLDRSSSKWIQFINSNNLLRFDILLLMCSSTPNNNVICWYTSSCTCLLVLDMILQLLIEAGCSWVLRRRGWWILPEDALLTWSCFRWLLSLLFNYWIWATIIITYTFKWIPRMVFNFKDHSTLWPRWPSLNLMKWVLIIVCPDTCRCHLKVHHSRLSVDHLHLLTLNLWVETT